MKVTNTKGFTLAELLIVMAIITVLAAVAIPTFSKQLETARETGDMEIIRSAYTDALSLAIIDASDGKLNGKRGDNSLTVTGVVTATAVTSGEPAAASNTGATYKMTIGAIKQSNSAWQYVNNTISGQTIGTAAKGNTFATFKFVLTDGVVTLDKVSDTAPITISDS